MCTLYRQKLTTARLESAEGITIENISYRILNMDSDAKRFWKQWPLNAMNTHKEMKRLDGFDLISDLHIKYIIVKYRGRVFRLLYHTHPCFIEKKNIYKFQFSKAMSHERNEYTLNWKYIKCCVFMLWTRLSSFGALGLISDPYIHFWTHFLGTVITKDQQKYNTVPSLYRHSIQRQNSLYWQFD